MTDTPYRAAPPIAPDRQSTSDFADAYLATAPTPDQPTDQEKLAGLANAARLVHEGAETKAVRDVAQKVLDAGPSLVALDKGTERLLRGIADGHPARDLLNPGTATILDRMVDCARDRQAAHPDKGPDISIVSVARPGDTKGPHRDGSAIDIRVYAGHTMDFHSGPDAVQGTVQFYKDMLGEGTARPPVDVRIALGLTRNPKTDADGAAREAQAPGKRAAYTVGDDERRMSVPVPTLKDAHVKPDFLLPRDAAVNDSPSHGNASADIDHLVPGAREQFRALYDTADHGRVLRFLMPDGWDHLHVQVVPPR